MKAHILMNGESQETLFEDIGSQVSFYVTEMVIYAMCREIAFCWAQMGPRCTFKTLKECCLHQLLGGTRDRIGDACFNPVT